VARNLLLGVEDLQTECAELSRLLAGLIPDAQIGIYPDATHGFLFPTEVAAAVNAFLGDRT
jgi:hypothetical protein